MDNPHSNLPALPPSLKDVCAERDRALEFYGQSYELRQLADERAAAALRYGRNGFHTHDLGQRRARDRAEHMAEVTRNLDRQLWRWAIDRSGLSNLLDPTARKEFEDAMQSGTQPFDHDTVSATLRAKIAEADMMIERGVRSLFESLPSRFKRNDAFSFGDKIAFDWFLSATKYNDGTSLSRSYSGSEKWIAELERVLHILDGKEPPSYDGGILHLLGLALRGFYHKAGGQIATEYVELRYFLKGSAHVRILRTDLVARLNAILAGKGDPAIPTRRENKRPTAPPPPEPTAKTAMLWETPVELADRMAAIAGVVNLPAGSVVLEPSAGTGRLVAAAARANAGVKIKAVELDGARCDELRGLAATIPNPMVVSQGDFLAMDGAVTTAPVSAVLLNPPFQHDVAHVRHAWDKLAPGGTLVAIMSNGPFFRQDRTCQEFRKWLDEIEAAHEKLPDGTFKESGTGVACRLVWAVKGALRPKA